MLMNFPPWFYFATVLIFFEENSQGGFLTNLRSRAVEAESKISNVMEVRHAAAKYLAFILSPLDEDSFNLCFNLVSEILLSWGMKVKSDTAYEFFSLETSIKNACVHGKKLRKTKAPDSQKSYITSDRHEGASTEIWLRQFQKYYEKFRAVSKHALHGGRTTEIVDTRSSLLFTRIPLGVLVCCIGNLDERECALLLNYAATGEITRIQKIQILKREESRKENLGSSGHGHPILLSSCGREWAFRGAALVFDLSACIEEICTAFCGSKDEMLDFICLMKGKTGNYLLKCIREVLSCVHHDKDEGRSLMLKDLSVRLIRWIKLGRDVFEGCAAFNDILDDLNRRGSVPGLSNQASEQLLCNSGVSAANYSNITSDTDLNCSSSEKATRWKQQDVDAALDV
ncbi:hypothetical protein Taro_052748 [Colocasia esculenta]|uniref:Uncharacterized protein n=1 Tax=Colocasia esculenta TaxID=4460 RepID=A0A843XK65_COLES|nr:hypothetical protein [Colocasia esculenta]